MNNVVINVASGNTRAREATGKTDHRSEVKI